MSLDFKPNFRPWKESPEARQASRLSVAQPL
jgi:hypothetical protein